MMALRSVLRLLVSFNSFIWITCASTDEGGRFKTSKDEDLLILVSLDAFGYDYLFRKEASTILRLGKYLDRLHFPLDLLMLIN